MEKHHGDSSCSNGVEEGVQVHSDSLSLGCERRLREAISLEVVGLELSDRAVLQALDNVREKLYLAVTGEAARRDYGKRQN